MRNYPGGWKGPTKSGHFIKVTHGGIQVITARQLAAILNEVRRTVGTVSAITAGAVAPHNTRLPRALSPKKFYGTKPLNVNYGKGVNPNNVILPNNILPRIRPPKTITGRGSPGKIGETQRKRKNNNSSNNNNNYGVNRPSNTPSPKRRKNNRSNNGGAGHGRGIAAH